MEPIRVALPLGIGDAHWACQKMRGLSEYHEGRPIWAYINKSPDHKTVGLLELVPFIEKAEYSHTAPYDIWHQMPPGHRHPKWSTLEGSAGWHGYDYIMVANGHLEMGKRIEDYFPELATDYTYDLQISQEDIDYAESLAAPNSVILYPSGVGPNRGFHYNTWRPGDWAEVSNRLNQHGIVPVFVGAKTNSDMSYMSTVKTHLRQNPLAQYVDTVGKTNIPQVLHMIRTASAWCGLNSGLGIMAGSQYVPTVMLWSDRRYPIRGVAQRVYLHENMQTAYLNEDQQKISRPMSFGSQELTPENVVRNILEVMNE